MRDEGLDEAIRVAGGVGALARKIGISQPSVSNWARVPAERVLSVEAATGVSRTILRPDLYGNGSASEGVDDLDAGRARNTRCYPALLARAPDRPLLERLATLRGDASSLGLAHAALAEAASRTTSERVKRMPDLLHRPRPRRIAAVRLLLPDRISARASAARVREDLDTLGIERVAVRRSRKITRHPVRDHGRPVRRRVQADLLGAVALFEPHLAPWSAVSSPIWSRPSPPISIVAWERWVACL